MRYLSTKIHGIGDYLIGTILLLLAAFPSIESTEGSIATSLVFGTVVILNSLLSDYELGLIGLLTMPFHLWIDLMAGLHLAAAPWFFNFSHVVFLPHLVIGILIVAAGLTTRILPSYAPSLDRLDRGQPIRQPDGVR